MGKRLVIEVSEETHRAFKTQASSEGKNIKEILSGLIDAYMMNSTINNIEEVTSEKTKA